MRYLVCLFLVLVSCSRGPNKDTMLPGIPSGLSAVAGPGEVRLSWQPNTENDLSRYNLYQGTRSGNLNKVSEILAGTETLTLTGLNSGTTYFFALDAEDKSGNRSLRSTEVSATPTLTLGVCVFNDAATTFNNCVFN